MATEQSISRESLNKAMDNAVTISHKLINSWLCELTTDQRSALSDDDLSKLCAKIGRALIETTASVMMSQNTNKEC